jgi:hypothetical protein
MKNMRPEQEIYIQGCDELINFLPKAKENDIIFLEGSYYRVYSIKMSIEMLLSSEMIIENNNKQYFICTLKDKSKFLFGVFTSNKIKAIVLSSYIRGELIATLRGEW